MLLLRFRTVSLLIAFSQLLLAGCSESQSAVEWDGSVRDSAGVTIVDNYGTPLWANEDRWTLSEVLRIGMVEGDPEYQFGSLSGFSIMSDGRIVVADQMAQRVRFYSPEGVHLKTVGSSGSGPKDFGEGWLSIIVVPGDTILVRDTRNERIHRLAPDGTWLGQFSTLPDDGRFVMGWDATPSGTLISGHSPLILPDTPAVDSMDLILIRDIRGAVLDTLARVPSQQVYRMAGDAPERHYYAGSPDFDLRWDGGIVTGRSDRYELRWYDETQTLERIVRLHRPPAPFTGRDQALLEDRFDAIMEQYQVPPERVARFRSTVRFEGTYPVFRAFYCGPQGTFWVQQVQPLTTMSESELETVGTGLRPPGSEKWDVFDKEGRYLGVVGIPVEMDFFLLQVPDKLIGRWTGELDVQQLVVFQILGMPTES